MAGQIPTVTCVGISVQDVVFRTEHPIEVGGKNLATSVSTHGGGPAANAAVTVASLGGRARLISKLGADTIGGSIVTDLARCGVDISLVRRLDGVSSPLSSVAVDSSGERTIVNHTDSHLIDSTHSVTIGDLEGSDSILVDLRWPDGARSAIAGASALAIPTIVDFDLTTTRNPVDIVASASHVVFSRSALVKLAGTADIDGALSDVATTTGAFVAVTLGGNGVKWIEHDHVRSLSAFPVKVVDTLGAGDVFHGAFAFGIASGRTAEEALRFASATAAIKCSRPSGRGAFPTGAEVEELLGATRRR
jgi:sulfofructose kinase